MMNKPKRFWPTGISLVPVLFAAMKMHTVISVKDAEPH